MLRAKQIYWYGQKITSNEWWQQRKYPSFLNGTLTPLDALRLGAYLMLRFPIDREADVRAYEAVVARFLGVGHVFALGSGRMGLYLLLKALEFDSGDEVILPGYTCVVMPNAVRFAGCKPVYADIRLSDFNVDPQALEAAITSRTRAVLMQHTFGVPADIIAVRDICRRHGLFLIEDGAHALGARYAGKPVGQWGDAAVFSSETSKMISTDKGGLLVTNDPVLAGKIERLYRALPIRSAEIEKLACMRIIYNVLTQDSIHWRASQIFDYLIRLFARRMSRSRDVTFPGYDIAEYEAELDGTQFTCYPRRLSGILCKIGGLQMERLRKDIENRNKKAELMARLLPQFGALIPTYDQDRCYPSFVKYPFLVEDRGRWVSALGKLGLPTATWLNDPLHPRETRCHRQNYYEWGCCPTAEYVSQHILNLPVGRTVSFPMLARLENLQL